MGDRTDAATGHQCADGGRTTTGASVDDDAKSPSGQTRRSPRPDESLSPSPDIVEQGKAIYEGKGTCMNCHGIKGRGDGPGAASLNPPPRVFRSHEFWKHRSEGEIFWVIKHGSPETAMIPFGGMLTDEEIWTVMQYERSFAGGYGRQSGYHGMSAMKGRQEKPGHEGEGHGSGGSEEGHDEKGCKKGKKDHCGTHHEDSLKQAEQAAGAAIHIQQAITAAPPSTLPEPLLKLNLRRLRLKISGKSRLFLTMAKSWKST